MAAAPLSKQQWKQRKDRGDWSYKQYLRWYKGNVGTRRPPAGDFSWLQALTPAQVMQQAHDYVSSQTTPLINQITNAINQRTRASTASINQQAALDEKNALAAYQSLHDAYAPLAGQSQQRYQAAAGELQGMNNVLADLVKGDANTTAAGIGQQLSAINAPDAAHAAFQQGAAELGKSLGNTSYATGVSSLARLVNEGVAEGNYFGTLPAIATAGGVANANSIRETAAQAVRDALSQGQTDLADQVGQIRAGVPGMVQQILGDLRSQEIEKAVATRAYGLDQYQAKTSRIAANASASRANRTGGTTYKPNEDPYNTSGTAGGRVLRQLTSVASGMFKRTKVPKGANGQPLVGIKPQPAPVPNLQAYEAVYQQAQQLLPQASPQQAWAVAQRALIAAGYAKAAQFDPFATSSRTVQASSVGQDKPPKAKPEKPQAGGERAPQASAAAAKTKAAAAAKGTPAEQKAHKAQELRRQAADDADAHASELSSTGWDERHALILLTKFLAQRYKGIYPNTIHGIAASAIARVYHGR